MAASLEKVCDVNRDAFRLYFEYAVIYYLRDIRYGNIPEYSLSSMYRPM